MSVPEERLQLRNVLKEWLINEWLGREGSGRYEPLKNEHSGGINGRLNSHTTEKVEKIILLSPLPPYLSPSPSLRLHRTIFPPYILHFSIFSTIFTMYYSHSLFFTLSPILINLFNHYRPLPRLVFLTLYHYPLLCIILTIYYFHSILQHITDPPSPLHQLPPSPLPCILNSIILLYSPLSSPFIIFTQFFNLSPILPQLFTNYQPLPHPILRLYP